MKIFVYGTLKRGYGNYDRLLANSSEFVGTGKTLGGYTMIHIGCPMVFQGGDHPVEGEVFDVDVKTLRRLDALEGEGRFYNRRLEIVDLDDGGQELCMIYVGAHLRPGERIVQPNDRGCLQWEPLRR